MEADVTNRVPIHLDIHDNILYAIKADAINCVLTIKFIYLRIIQEFCVTLQIVFKFTEA